MEEERGERREEYQARKIVGGNSSPHLVIISIRLTDFRQEEIKMFKVGYYFMVDYFQKISFREIRINLL